MQFHFSEKQQPLLPACRAIPRGITPANERTIDAGCAHASAAGVCIRAEYRREFRVLQGRGGVGDIFRGERCVVIVFAEKERVIGVR